MRGSPRATSPPPSVLPGIERDSGDGQVPMVVNATICSGDSVAASIGAETTVFDDHAGELDDTLRSVLETIMDHAMSREIIYEEYEMRRERI